MIFKHAISWFEIPTMDIERAKNFYEKIFDIKMITMDTANLQMRLFPIENMMNIGGSLVCHKDFYKPSSTEGPLIYLNGNPDVQLILDKIKNSHVTVFRRYLCFGYEYFSTGVFNLIKD